MQFQNNSLVVTCLAEFFNSVLNDVTMISTKLILLLIHSMTSMGHEPIKVNYQGLPSHIFEPATPNEPLKLRLIGNKLFVGGRGLLYVLNTDNITSNHRVQWRATPDETKVCQYLPQGSLEKCYNFIRMIQPYNSSHLLLCGTMAIEPQNQFLRLSDMDLSSADSMISTALCSYEVDDPGCSVLGEVGGAFSSIAATTRRAGNTNTNLVKNLPMRKHIQATLGRSKMVDEKAEFVGSFAYDDVTSGRLEKKLYFVFGEDAREPGSSNGHATRIAQVCANDAGGQGKFSGVWTSFLKVWLTCQTDENPPFRFPLVTDIAVHGGVLYGTFTSESKRFQVSAVCAFKISDIQQAFSTRDYWEVDASNGVYYITSTYPRTPGRPGICAHPGMMGLANTTSKDFSWDFINFITQHPLIEGSITPTLAPNGNSPQVTSQQMSRDKELFTKIAVQNVIDNSGIAHSVVFVGTKSGKVIKFITINQDTKPETLELMEVTWGNSPIDDLVLSEANNQLFVHTGGAVIQMSTTNCAAYSTSCGVCDACTMCVLSRDPMCGWDASIEQCVAMGGGTLLQNIESGTTRECGEIQSKIKRSKAPEIGSNEIVGRRVDSQSVIATWYKMFPNGSKLALQGQDRYRHLSDSRLEIDPFLPSDVTTFVCDYTLYDITVGRDQVIYSNDVTIPPVAVVTPTSIGGSTEEKSLGGVPPNGTPPNEETVGTPEPPAPREAGISPIVIVIVVVCIVIIILLVACVYHKRCRKPKYIGAKYQTNEKPPNPPAAETVATSNENNSNKVSLVAVDNPDDEHNLLLSNNKKIGETPSPEQRKIAHVTPMQKGEDIQYIDEAPREAAREYARKPPVRTKSIPKENIKISLGHGGHGDFRCNSIRKSKRGTWIFELDLPPDVQITDDNPSPLDLTDVSFDPAPHHLPPEGDRGADGWDASGEFPHMKPAQHDRYNVSFAPNNHTPQDSDKESDSTICAGHSSQTLDVIKQTDDVTTPRGKNPQLPSSYSRYAQPTLRDSPARSNKSPMTSSVTSSSTTSSSTSSDKYQTAPPSPVRPIV